jgi:hypothetical protein
MEIWHRVAFNGDADQGFKTTIDDLGIKHGISPLPGHSIGLVFFDISESDPRWTQIEKLIRTTGASDIVNTKFTTEEILNSEWARLVPTFEQDYPQPEATWVRNPINYEQHCPECGTFLQTASFRLKKEPALGKNAFVSLYWTYALFCAVQLLTELEAHEIRGYEIWDAIIHRINAPSERVSQLFIPHVTQPGLVRVEELRREMCPLCHVTKYYPYMRGVMYLKHDALVPEVDIMQTYEWFGSGHSAYREVLVSNRFARLVIDQGWKGVALKPIELV